MWNRLRAAIDEVCLIEFGTRDGVQGIKFLLGLLLHERLVRCIFLILRIISALFLRFQFNVLHSYTVHFGD